MEDLREFSLETIRRLTSMGKKYVLDWCTSVGMIAKECTCTTCGSRMKLVHCKRCVDGFVWMCRVKKKESKHEVRKSVRCGSWFSKSKLSIPAILKITYLWVFKAPNQLIVKEASVSERGLTEWKNFCREVCMDVCLKNKGKIGGPGKVVEINESRFGEKKYCRGRIHGKWVFSGVERNSMKYFFTVVEHRNKDTLLEIIGSYIVPGTTIISNCWKSYDCLSHEGYVRLKVNRTYTFKDPETGAHTNAIEGSWASIIRDLQGTCQVKEQFDKYLAEYMWRRAGNQKCDELFVKFITAIIDLYPPGVEPDVEENTYTKIEFVAVNEMNFSENDEGPLKEEGCFEIPTNDNAGIIIKEEIDIDISDVESMIDMCTESHSSLKQESNIVKSETLIEEDGFVSERRLGDASQDALNSDQRVFEKLNILNNMSQDIEVELYQCNDCAYRSTSKKDLIRHVRKHTGKKAYSCSYCGFRCSQKLSLVGHLGTHMGEKPYSCSYCDHRCSLKTSLVRHLRTHAEEKSESIYN